MLCEFALRGVGSILPHLALEVAPGFSVRDLKPARCCPRTCPNCCDKLHDHQAKRLAHIYIGCRAPLNGGFHKISNFV